MTLRRSKKCHPIIMASEAKTEFDRDERKLLQDYQNVVDCLFSCDHIIKDLERQLDSKDQRLAAKDELISSLEDKIVKMSLELASTKAREDELRDRLKKGATSVRASKCDGGSSSQASAPFNCARYRPISTSSRKLKEAGNQRESPIGTSNGGGKNQNDVVLNSSTKTSSTNTTMSIDNGQSLSLDDSYTSRLYNFGKIVLDSLGDECGREQVQILKVEDSEKKGEIRKQNNVDAGPKRPRLRTLKPRKNELLKCSIKGVIFPVTSFDVVKGCIASSSFNNRIKGCIGRKNEGPSGQNEEWPVFGS